MGKVPDWVENGLQNPHITSVKRRSLLYYRRLHLATPSWADSKAINAYYKLARSTGKEVDHIVPLSHPCVCGLHCEANLQLLTPEQNLSKSNFHWPDAPYETFQLFNDPYEPEQYELPL